MFVKFITIILQFCPLIFYLSNQCCCDDAIISNDKTDFASIASKYLYDVLYKTTSTTLGYKRTY